jgi:hypothetical protein
LNERNNFNLKFYKPNEPSMWKQKKKREQY